MARDAGQGQRSGEGFVQGKHLQTNGDIRTKRPMKNIEVIITLSPWINLMSSLDFCDHRIDGAGLAGYLLHIGQSTRIKIAPYESTNSTSMIDFMPYG